jgi:glycerate-2-kinase
MAFLLMAVHIGVAQEDHAKFSRFARSGDLVITVPTSTSENDLRAILIL